MDTFLSCLLHKTFTSQNEADEHMASFINRSCVVLVDVWNQALFAVTHQRSPLLQSHRHRMGAEAVLVLRLHPMSLDSGSSQRE